MDLRALLCTLCKALIEVILISIKNADFGIFFVLDEHGAKALAGLGKRVHHESVGAVCPDVVMTQLAMRTLHGVLIQKDWDKEVEQVASVLRQPYMLELAIHALDQVTRDIKRDVIGRGVFLGERVFHGAYARGIHVERVAIMRPGFAGVVLNLNKNKRLFALSR